ncbi:MAG: hypothetical protein KDB23_32095, partial [Planctomycetales bacterium]|nr:hypothetical protein [Planctomycetales bacterium]
APQIWSRPFKSVRTGRESLASCGGSCQRPNRGCLRSAPAQTSFCQIARRVETVGTLSLLTTNVDGV